MDPLEGLIGEVLVTKDELKFSLNLWETATWWLAVGLIGCGCGIPHPHLTGGWNAGDMVGLVGPHGHTWSMTLSRYGYVALLGRRCH